MDVLFALLFLLSSLGLTIGFVNPRLVLPGSGTKTRKRVGITYGISTFAFMVLTGVTASTPQEQTATPPPQANETPTPTPTLEPIPSVSVTPLAVKSTPVPGRQKSSSADSLTPPKPSTTGSLASEPFSNTNAVVVGDASSKNIRSGPGTDYRVQHIAYPGDRVRILDSAQDSGGYTWYKVQFPKSGAQGWLAAQLIEQDGSSVAPESDESSAPTSEAAPSSSVTRNSIGPARCDHPDDLDARGRRCGKRAASERPGGR